MELQPPPPPPPPPPRPAAPPTKSYKLTAQSISYTKPTTLASKLPKFLLLNPDPPAYILRRVSFTAFPSQILAVVGPSGAGKSTLLDILAARTSPSDGAVLLDSAPINPSAYRKLSAYVPQHDAALPQLTVAETFMFSARLLHPKSADLSATVESILAELSLAHLANVRLSGGLSGGERRRVSIGLTLLHDPAILLLDEPTSGLDSKSALNVIQSLKSIAVNRRRTVVLSIHQPSFKILSLIDNFLLLTKGSVIHHGNLFSLQSFLISNGFTLPPQLNSLEYAMEIINQLNPENSQSPIQETPKNPLIETLEIESSPPLITYKSSRIHEITVLYSRFWKIIYRTKQLLLTNSLEALIVGLVLGTIYINIGFNKEGIEKRFGLFAFTLTFLLSSTTETLPIFINERPIIIRETSSGIYRLSSYLIANTLVFLPYLLAIAVIYSVSVYFLVGLCSNWAAFGYFVLVIWVVVLMANSFVLFLSSLAPNYIAGTSSVTVLLGAFFLFSGYFISPESMPKYWVFMHFVSMYKYALDALLINEYSCVSTKCFLWYGETTAYCMVTGGDVLEKKGLSQRNKWVNVYVLIGFFILYRVMCLLVLIRRVSRSKS